MPHVPWQYLPSGRLYRRQPNDAIPALSNQAYEDTGQLDVLLQRHFLQTGFADLELQELWKRLKSEGLWDKSLIVVAADHGVAFPHARERRRLSRKTAREIAPIPLFIKAPGQKAAKVNKAVGRDDRHPADDPRHPERRPEGADGRPVRVQLRPCSNRKTLRFEIREQLPDAEDPGGQFERERAQIIARNHRLFGSGADGPQRIYEIGPHPELIGQPAVSGRPAARRGAGRRGRLRQRGSVDRLRPHAHRREA